MIRSLFMAAVLWLVTAPADASDWPQRPITLLHGFGAGGNADSLSRLVAGALTDTLGVAVVVEAKPGAGGNIASEFVSRAAPDGYSIILLTGGHAVSAAMYKKLRFDPINSFSFVSLVGTFPFVVATRADSPISSLSDLVAAARKDPGKLTFSSVGFGSTQHLTGELLAIAAGIKLTHVPYRGGMQPLTDVLGGQIDLIVDTITVTGPAVKGGTLKALGVTSASAWPTLPNVPAIATQLSGFEVRSWIGIAAPAGTPPDIVTRLNEGIAKAVADPNFQKKLDLLGVMAGPTSPDGMKTFVASEIKRWNEVIEKAALTRVE